MTTRPVTTGNHGDGILKESTVAKLLLQKQKYPDHIGLPKCHQEPGPPPLDLSFTARNKDLDTITLKRKACDFPDYPNSRRKCVCCAFIANDSASLYSHYQTHRQGLTRPASAAITQDNIRRHQPTQIPYNPHRHDTSASTSPTGNKSDDSTTLRSLLCMGDRGTSTTAPTTNTMFKLRTIIHTALQQGYDSSNDGRIESRDSSRAVSPYLNSKDVSRVSSPKGEASIDSVRLMSMMPSSSLAAYLKARVDEAYPPGTRLINTGVAQAESCPSSAPQSPTTQVYIKEENVDTSYPDLSQYSRSPAGDTTLHNSFNYTSSSDHEPDSSPQLNTQSYTPTPFTAPTPFTTYQRLPTSSKDAEIQCDLYTNGHSSSSSNESSHCQHCGITFDDKVMYSIHIGCHNHANPFICNVCGKHCEHKYAFYTHIMRGHECS